MRQKFLCYLLTQILIIGFGFVFFEGLEVSHRFDAWIDFIFLYHWFNFTEILLQLMTQMNDYLSSFESLESITLQFNKPLHLFPIYALIIHRKPFAKSCRYSRTTVFVQQLLAIVTSHDFDRKNQWRIFVKIIAKRTVRSLIDRSSHLESNCTQSYVVRRLHWLHDVSGH